MYPIKYAKLGHADLKGQLKCYFLLVSIKNFQNRNKLHF